ncbi:hypothetical protein PSAC2689_30569 [Paraburkholderia sacchari]
MSNLPTATATGLPAYGVRATATSGTGSGRDASVAQPARTMNKDGTSHAAHRVARCFDNTCKMGLLTHLDRTSCPANDARNDWEVPREGPN